MPLFSVTACAIKSRFGFQDHGSFSSSPRCRYDLESDVSVLSHGHSYWAKGGDFQNIEQSLDSLTFLRGWDQFKANETLFGVKSTFNKDLYTTKLDKGLQMKELEREALRIDREIEGEDTHDLHLAEERGLQLHKKYELDEESEFSSVFRELDDGGYDDTEDNLLDTQNNETFGDGYVPSIGKSFADLGGKLNEGAHLSTRSPTVDEASSQLTVSREAHQFGANDHARQFLAGHLSKDSLISGDIWSLECCHE